MNRLVAEIAIGLLLVEILVVVVVGGCAKLAGLNSIDGWAERRLNDTDGQGEKESAD